MSSCLFSHRERRAFRQPREIEDIVVPAGDEMYPTVRPLTTCQVTIEFGMSGVQDNLPAVGALCAQGLSAGRYRSDQAAHGPGGSVIERERGEDAVACFGAAIALFEWQTLALRLLLASGNTA